MSKRVEVALTVFIVAAVIFLGAFTVGLVKL